MVLRLAFLIALGASTAAAQDNVERARQHFEAGTAAFDTGDYGRAVAEFQASYELTHHPDILFNIYSAAERDGQYAIATQALERYLAEGQVEATRRPALEQRLQRLRERNVQPEPDPDPDPDPEPDPDPAPQVPASRSSGGVHPAGIGVIAAAGVLGLTFAGLAIGAALEADGLANGCGATRSCTDGEVGTLHALNIAADVSWVTAAVAGVAGIVLIVVLPPEQSSTAIVPWIGPDTAGISIGGRM